MPFRVAARTLLHLGSELISSDAVAFYELVKNAFDAGSPRIDIRIVAALPHELQTDLSSRLAALVEEVRSRNSKTASTSSRSELDAIRRAAAAGSNTGTPDATTLLSSVAKARTPEDLHQLIVEANYIVFEDTGEGMSERDLDEVYLTIGTRARLKQRRDRSRENANKRDSSRVILGEKGVGRLSAMRLGNRLMVQSTRTGEVRWNLLYIDWTRFSHDSDILLEDVDISPQQGSPKKEPNTSGTILRISDLTSDWDRAKISETARRELSKLTDPFVPRKRYPISIRFNGDAVPIPRLDTTLFEQAHAHVTAALTVDEGGARLSGAIDYRLHGYQKDFEVSGIHLESLAQATGRLLHRLGPFSVTIYWYNRLLLREVEGIGNRQEVLAMVAAWSGGLMVFRDGFRVHPYGGPDDDWLDLDRAAFGSGGYKINRAQIIGKVDITADDNPRLIDQTNREGLRDCPEKNALVLILKHVLLTEMKDYLEDVDAEVKAREPITFDDLDARVTRERRRLSRSIEALIRRHPDLKNDPQLLRDLSAPLEEIDRILSEAKALADTYQSNRSELVHLAGIGLMVEFVAHELHRATANTLRTLGNVDAARLEGNVASVFTNLRSQLGTLQKRLKVLDPLSTTARQRKETLDLAELVEGTVAGHADQFERHDIGVSVHNVPRNRKGPFRILAVRGMLVQILENLISNSLYWLQRMQDANPDFEARIDIAIDRTAGQIRVTDNGPGVPVSERERIFRPFVTTKPAGEGKGLGLYIAREVARYNGADVFLEPSPEGDAHPLNTFVIALEAQG